LCYRNEIMFLVQTAAIHTSTPVASAVNVKVFQISGDGICFFPFS
jgi:hypothetical protein